MLPSKTKDIYENRRVLDHTGALLFRTSERRQKWYLERGLARQIDEQTIQLTFVNQGRGRQDEPYYLQDMANTCVVCNASESLTLHHIVPRQYRQYMEDEYKSHASYDLLPLCIVCHDRYERHATRFKMHLAECFEAPLQGVGWEERPDIRQAGRAAAALLKANRSPGMIPETRIAELRDTVTRVCLERREMFATETQERVFGLGDSVELDEGVLGELCMMEDRVQGPGFRSHGEIVVGRVASGKGLGPIKGCAECRLLGLQGVRAFVVCWRKHFVEYACPKYLPDHWIVDYPGMP